MTKPTAAKGDFPTSYEQYQAGNWPYEVVPKNPEEHDDAIAWQGLHEFAFKSEEGDLYAGCYPRAMINNAANTDQPLMIGASDRGNRSVGILHDERYRHIFCGGQTGAGKTVAAKNAVQQDALAGHGVCVIDPGGEDILDIVRSLPHYRLRDLIYMEPGNEYREYSIGLNYLDTLHNPGEPGYKKECESIASNLLPMLNADEFARMKGVASNMLRYLIKADYEDDGYEYTLIDLYYMLASDDARQQYASLVNESKHDFLKVYANKIAELAGDDLEPLLRRLQTWVESDVIRPFIAQRDSDFSIADAVENQRIVLVKANLGKSEREMITAALTTKLWSAITSRPNADERRMMEYEGVEVPKLGAEDGGDHKPFFLVADEFHAVASENTDIGEMLAMARKKGLGLYILTQQLGQLSGEQQQQILGNCSTLMAFDPGRHPKERGALASGFDGIEEPDLGIGRYKFWTTLTDEKGDESQAFLTHSIPPFPPVRSVKEANEALNHSQQLHGSKRLSDQDIINQVPDEFSVGAARESLSGSDEVDQDQDVEPRAMDRAAVIQAVYDEAYLESDENYGYEPVPMEDVEDRIQRYLKRIDSAFVPETASQYTALLGYIPTERLERFEDDDGTFYLRCTEDGKMRFTSPAVLAKEDDEVNENVGGPKHAALMREGYDQWLDLSFGMQIHIQDGGNLPDATLTPHSEELDRIRSDDYLDEIKRAELLLQFRENNQRLDRISNARPVALEAEHYTGSSAPAQTLTNLAAALEAGQRCILLARPKTATAIWKKINQEPYMMREFDEPGASRLYNKNRDLRVGEDQEKVYRPSGCGQSVWLLHDDGTYELRDSEGETRATFDDSADITADVDAYPKRESEIKDFDEWSAIKAPLVPEEEFTDVEAGGPLPPEKYDVADVRSAEKPLRVVTGPGEDDRQDVAALGDGRRRNDEGLECGSEGEPESAIEPESGDEPRHRKDTDESESRPSAPSFSTD